jgi:hypothetical protein
MDTHIAAQTGGTQNRMVRMVSLWLSHKTDSDPQPTKTENVRQEVLGILLSWSIPPSKQHHVRSHRVNHKTVPNDRPYFSVITRVTRAGVGRRRRSHSQSDSLEKEILWRRTETCPGLQRHHLPDHREAEMGAYDVTSGHVPLPRPKFVPISRTVRQCV